GLQCSVSLVVPRAARSPLFPYTTLFRSAQAFRAQQNLLRRNGRRHVHSTPFRPLWTGLKGFRSPDFKESGGRMGRSLRDETRARSEEHTSELQSLRHLVCRLPLATKNDT